MKGVAPKGSMLASSILLMMELPAIEAARPARKPARAHTNRHTHTHIHTHTNKHTHRHLSHVLKLKCPSDPVLVCLVKVR